MAEKIPESLYTLEADQLPAEIAAQTFPKGDYAVSEKLKRSKYEERLLHLQIELVKLQAWVRETGERIVMVFEGRDAAGKGGTIKRFTAYMNPRHARVVALSKPSDVERGQWYFQRYVPHMPTEGDILLFDRSWYNRAGVERVMGFCSEEDVETFFAEAPVFEGMLAREGLKVFKLWLTIERPEQLKRFYERKNNPLKSWKLSPMDHAAIGKWHDYTRAIHDMLRRTDTPHAPWTVVDSNDQRRARLECIKVVLNAFDYTGKDAANIGEIDERITMSVDAFLKREAP
jgi:polyphosphate kinase 2